MDQTRESHTKWSKSDIERQIPYDITYMWNLKYGTNEPIYKTETDSQTQRTDLWLVRGGGTGVGWIGSLGLEVMETITFKMDKKLNPAV